MKRNPTCFNLYLNIVFPISWVLESQIKCHNVTNQTVKPTLHRSKLWTLVSQDSRSTHSFYVGYALLFSFTIAIKLFSQKTLLFNSEIGFSFKFLNSFTNWIINIGKCVIVQISRTPISILRMYHSVMFS